MTDPLRITYDPTSKEREQRRALVKHVVGLLQNYSSPIFQWQVEEPPKPPIYVYSFDWFGAKTPTREDFSSNEEWNDFVVRRAL